MKTYLLFSLIFSAPFVHANLRWGDLFPSDREKFEIPKDEETLVIKGQNPEQVIAPGQTLSFLVWNIHKAKDDKLWPDLRQLHKSADFILIQEANLNLDQCGHFEDLGFTEWATSISFWIQPHTATGVTNGGRYYAAEHDFIRSPDREPVIKTPKMATYSRYPIEGKKQSLVVVNLHGMNVTPKGYLKNQLNAIAKRIGNHNGPLVVAGDFNTKNSARIEIMNDFADDLGLKNLPLKYDDRKKKLDHILARGFDVIRSEILIDFKSSDHPALWAELKLD